METCFGGARFGDTSNYTVQSRVSTLSGLPVWPDSEGKPLKRHLDFGGCPVLRHIHTAKCGFVWQPTPSAPFQEASLPEKRFGLERLFGLGGHFHVNQKVWRLVWLPIHAIGSERTLMAIDSLWRFGNESSDFNFLVESIGPTKSKIDSCGGVSPAAKDFFAPWSFAIFCHKGRLGLTRVRIQHEEGPLGSFGRVL